MLSLKPFRSKAAGLPDLLNYAALVDEGVVLGKDGSLMAGFFFRGDDAASATTAERNYLTALVNQYLSRFGSGWATWIDAARVASPGYTSATRSYFPDPITALIDAERRAAFEKQDALFETEYALILQYLPPLRRNSKLGELVYDDDSRQDSNPADRLLADFKKKLEDFHDGLGDLLHMRRMGTIAIPETGGVENETYDSDELVNYLHFTLTNEPIALRIPDCPMYLDAWLGYPELWPGDTPKLGKKFISCVAIEGFPGHSFPGILDMLDGLPMAYRWTSRFIFLEQHEAVAALNRYRLKWQQKIRGFWSQVMKSQKGMINTDALNMTAQTEVAINDAKSGLVAYGYYTPVVVLMHEDRAFLEEQARFVKRELERKGFGARVESVNALEAWLGSLPGQTYPNVRRPLVHTLNLADLLPLAGVWPGLRENPCDLYPAGSPPLMHTVTTGETPFRLNLHVGDVGHTLIFGATGAGKSTLLAMIHAQFRRYRSRQRRDGKTRPATITAFDKGRSLYALCKATGGIHYDIGNDEADTPALAPLVDIDGESDALWAEEWIATCFELQAQKPPTPEQKAEIHRAMNLLRKTPRNFRSLTDYVTTVQNGEVRDALTHYTITGSMGHLLDGQEESLTISPYTVFEIDDLMKMGNANAIPVLLYLFHRFERSLTGQPAMLSLDEAWVVLGHPVFREKLREWLKELRKKNCLVIMATQSLSDAVASGLLDVMIEQCPTKIFLPNKEAHLHGTKETPGSADLYTMFGLNPAEINILKTGQYKKHYYYKSPLGRRLFELGLGQLALAFVAVSGKEDLAEVRHLIGEHGADWPLVWLKQKGVNYEQYLSQVPV
ncbi:TraG/VirB4 family ATPase [Xenorhabdus bovienii]|uniref:Conjugal transfer protein TrbE n=1 Tax=Xenorhabdus bovienii str. feltiae Moldova TaxID=1398200 RepID=A0A077NUY8_XENBV|nr:transporter [Xenorhabdus bovienii]CDG91748.1 Conjugal transfer protein TrbE [Xenorhabdus bovienii str. feltiae Florida]CDH01446.1 Conjugal transfer protein TrbE [Xenorhabdus bovienii str. feltiae Moldova]